VLVAVGAHQVRQHHRVATIRLLLRDGVAIAIAARRHRVDRVDRVPGGAQGPHHQPARRLDADHHLRRVGGVLGDQRVELRQPRRRVVNPPAAQHPAVIGHQADVVPLLRPVDPDQDHGHLLQYGTFEVRAERRSAHALIDRCSKHDIPPVVTSPRQPVAARSPHRARGPREGKGSTTVRLGGKGTTCRAFHRIPGCSTFPPAPPIPGLRRLLFHIPRSCHLIGHLPY
jgi:hypothetical protein